METPSDDNKVTEDPDENAGEAAAADAEKAAQADEDSKTDPAEDEPLEPTPEELAGDQAASDAEDREAATTEVLGDTAKAAINADVREHYNARFPPDDADGEESEEAYRVRIAKEAEERAAFPKQTISLLVAQDAQDLGCVVYRFDQDAELIVLERLTTVMRTLGRDDRIEIFPLYGTSGEHFRASMATLARKD